MAFKSSSSNRAASPVSVPKPADVVDGNVLLAKCYHDLGDGTSWSAQAGWNLIWTGRDTNGQDRTVGYYWRIVDGDTDTYVFTHGSTTGASTVVINAYGGQYSGNPFDVVFDAALHKTVQNNNNNPVCPAIETNTANAIVVLFSAISHNSITGAGAPAGFDLRGFGIGNAYDDSQIVSADAVIPEPGVVTPTVWQNTDNGNNYAESTNFIVALKPPSAPDPDPDPDPGPDPDPDPSDTVVFRDLTYTFNMPVVHGTFVGQLGPWVEKQAGLQILSITSSGAGALSSQLNPTSGDHQALHSAAGRYDASLKVTFPLDVTGGDSLVTGQAKTTEDKDCDGRTADSHVELASFEILTIVDTVPDANAFRPAPVDRSHTMYLATDVDASVLPARDTTGMTQLSAGTFSTVEERLSRCVERPWAIYVHGWEGRDIHALNNMPGYHEYCGDLVARIATYLCSDQPKGAEFINRVVQWGIDYYHHGISGTADSAYFTIPVLLAGKLLNNSAMLNAFTSDAIGVPGTGTPRDYPDIYFVADRVPSTSSAIVPAGQTWLGTTVAYCNNTGAHQLYEHLHPSEFALADDAWKDEFYRYDIDSYIHVGAALGARLLGVETDWGNPATFAYVERWMNEDHQANFTIKAPHAAAHYGTTEQIEIDKWLTVRRSGHDFIDDMFATYWNATDIQAPTVPQNVSAVSAGETAGTVTWDISTDNVAVTGYRIYVDGVLHGTSATNSYTITGLSHSTTYMVTVSAYDAVPNESAQSTSDSFTTNVASDNEDPSVPTNVLAASTGTDSGTASWSASTDNVVVTGYRVYLNGVEVGTTTELTYSFTGLSPNTGYVVTVSAFDAVGNESAQSTDDSFTTDSLPDIEAPTVPTSIFAASTGTDTANASWANSTDNVAVTGYRVYLNGVEVDTTTELNYSFTGLVPNTEYQFTVSAFDGAGNESSQSVVVSFTTDAAPVYAAYLTAVNIGPADTQLFTLNTETDPDQWEGEGGSPILPKP